MAKRLNNKQLEDVLDAHFFPLLGEVSETDKQDIINRLNIISVRKGDILFREGDTSDFIYTILSGRLEVFIHNANKEEEIVGEARRGETIGEMALFTNDNRSATVRALRNCVLARLSNEEFLSLCIEKPDFAISIARVTIQRLKNMNRNIRKKADIGSMAFALADESSVSDECLRKLISHFQNSENVFVYDAALHHSKWGDAEVLSNQMKADFDYLFPDLEADHNYVIIDLRGIKDSIAAELCNYVDVSILFHDPYVKDSESRVDQKAKLLVKDLNSRLQLVRCYPDRSVELRHLAHTFTIDRIAQISVKDDIARLYRYLTGKSIGLVLGGGGAKGLAHIGVIKALHDHDIPIDYICGTSMGAIIAAAYAQVKSPTKLEAAVRALFGDNPTSLSDLSRLPIFSFYRGRKVEEKLNEFFGDRVIGALWLPFFCITSNLSDSVMNVQRTGKVKDVVRASMSVPGLFPPTILDGKLHVDGAIFNNIPIDILTKEGLGFIMASRVDQEAVYPLGSSVAPTGLRKLRYLLHRDKSFPSLMSTFMKTTMANCEQHAKSVQDLVDVFFQPKVEHFGLLNWGQIDDLIAEGYNHADELLSTKRLAQDSTK